MRSIHQWLDEYGESHRNPLNKAIHWVAVPAIVWTVVALLWSIPFPLEIGFGAFPVNWAVIALLLAQVYWFRLSTSLGFGLLVYNVVMIWLTLIVRNAAPWPLWQVAVTVFIAAWVFQFVGHTIEGRRPSFFRDVQFLLIGPAWLLAFIYRGAGLKY